MFVPNEPETTREFSFQSAPQENRALSQNHSVFLERCNVGVLKASCFSVTTQHAFAAKYFLRLIINYLILFILTGEFDVINEGKED